MSGSPGPIWANPATRPRRRRRRSAASSPRSPRPGWSARTRRRWPGMRRVHPPCGQRAEHAAEDGCPEQHRGALRRRHREDPDQDVRDDRQDQRLAGAPGEQDHQDPGRLRERRERLQRGHRGHSARTAASSRAVTLGRPRRVAPGAARRTGPPPGRVAGAGDRGQGRRADRSSGPGRPADRSGRDEPDARLERRHLAGPASAAFGKDQHAPAAVQEPPDLRDRTRVRALPAEGEAAEPVARGMPGSDDP